MKRLLIAGALAATSAVYGMQRSVIHLKNDKASKNDIVVSSGGLIPSYKGRPFSDFKGKGELTAIIPGETITHHVGRISLLVLDAERGWLGSDYRKRSYVLEIPKEIILKILEDDKDAVIVIKDDGEDLTYTVESEKKAPAPEAPPLLRMQEQVESKKEEHKASETPESIQG